MWNDSSNHKKIAFIAAFIFILGLTFIISFKAKPVAFAFAEPTESVTEEEIKENVNGILGGIDSNELDDYLTNEFDTDFFSVNSFKSLVTKILDGSYFDEYGSLMDAILDFFKQNVKGLFSLILTLFVLVILHQLFNNFCAEKHEDLKKAMHIVFSLLIALVVVISFKDVATMVSETITKIFNFCKILFPILLNLVLLSGATGSHSVYSTLSVFLLNTGSYVFVYVLLPISISILLLSVVGSALGGKKFSKFADILRSIFKYTISIFFGIFGVLSAVNLIMSGTKDGVSLKITKYAIKNYVPVLGGYISEGFDFVHTCSVLVKNAFGVCGVLVLLFMVIRPLIIYLVYLLMFKILSLLVSFVGADHFSSMFENVSKCMAYFIAVLVGVFLIFFVFVYLLVISVSVV